jgi:hypothetical protein
LLNEHGSPHYKRGYVCRIFGSEIVYPKRYKRSVTKLNRIEQDPIQGKEDGNLYDYRQTSAKRVYLVGSVKLHGFAV